MEQIRFDDFNEISFSQVFCVSDVGITFFPSADKKLTDDERLGDTEEN
jgi:hypothetical protein